MGEYLPFEEARSRVQSLCLRNFSEWKQWASSPNRPVTIPSNPERVYKGRFKGYGNWIGNFSKRRRRGRKNQFLPFEEAREFARSLGLKNSDEWRVWAATGKRPLNIPNNPRTFYRGEFLGFRDWLGN